MAVILRSKRAEENLPLPVHPELVEGCPPSEGAMVRQAHHEHPKRLCYNLPILTVMDMDTNVLYWGDNLHILRNKDYFPDQSVDLVYLDPPFNSNASYNVLFKEATGEQSTAQLQAFTDTWHWNQAAAVTTEAVLDLWTKWLGACRCAVGSTVVSH